MCSGKSRDCGFCIIPRALIGCPVLQLWCLIVGTRLIAVGYVPIKLMRQTIQNKNLSKKKSRVQKKKISKSTSNRLVVLTDVGRFAPDRLVANLCYCDSTTTRTHASSNAANYAYRSSAYDPDPSLGTGAIPGFAELANLYGQYLVREMHLDGVFGNQDVHNYPIGIWPSNTIQNVNSLTASEIQEYSSNPNSIRDMLPTANAGDRKFRMSAVGIELYGRQFLTDEKFSGSTAGNPSQMYGINIGFFDGTGVNMSYPIVTNVTVVYVVEFFGILQLQS